MGNDNSDYSMVTGQREPYFRSRKRRGWLSVAVGAGFVWFAYLIFFRSTEFIVRQSGHVETYQRVDYPMIFNFAALATLLIGAYELIRGAVLIIGTWPEPELIPRGRYSAAWGIFNAVLLLLFACLGYSGLILKIPGAAESKWALCIGAFVVCLVCPFGNLHFSSVSTFRKPQWARSPFRWWHDPLQVLYVGTCWFAGFFLGTASRFFISHLSVDDEAVWSVVGFAGALAGLLVGQALAYAAYKNQIEN